MTTIIFKCKCGRNTTYGIRCVVCSGLELEDLVKEELNKESEEYEEETEEN